MKTLKSTLGFDAQIQKADGSLTILPKSTLPIAPTVQNGIAIDLPAPTTGVLWLVNAMVFAATDRPDFVMFAPELTVRDESGKAIAQGGYVKRNGEIVKF